MTDVEKTRAVDGQSGGLDGADDATTRRARALELDGLPLGPVGEYARSLRDLGLALGLSKARAGQLKDEDWFPKRTERGWVVDACRRAVAAKRRGETPPVLAPVAPAAPAPPASSAPLPAQYPPPLDAPPGANPLMDRERERARLERDAAEADRDLLAVLLTSTDPLELVKAKAILASRRLAREVSEGRQWVQAKQAEEEWRRMEAARQELAKERGELIERAVAQAVIGQLARRFVLACGNLETRIASQVEVWLADEAFRRLTSEERLRIERAWVSSQTRQARLAETETAVWEEIERMLVAEIADRKATS